VPSLLRGEAPAQLPSQRSWTERWDREWIHYFTLEDPRPFLRPHTALHVAADLRPLSAREVYRTALTRELGAISIFMPGGRLAGGRVFEVGCGPGFLCKQLGLVADKVVGIDHSKFALSIARLVSPRACSYLHTSRVARLWPLYGSFDAMVGRHFFIHQNYANSLRLLGLARRLLTRGGLVGADFLIPDPATPGCVVFPAKSPLSLRYPSCGFVYTPQEIEELARATGFRVNETWELPPPEGRRLVLLERN
jgi:SAM-dependent methyltransferase